MAPFPVFTTITAAMQLLILLLLVPSTTAFFRHICSGEVGKGRIDPIMSPDNPSTHVHGIHGASNMGLDVTTESLMASNCTSCAVRQDKSAYWAPYLYFQHDNGTYAMVPKVGGMIVYYFTETPADMPDAKIVAFPNGFRMMAGNNFKRAKWDTVETQVKPPNRETWSEFDQEQQLRAGNMIGFNCLHYNGGFNEDSLGRHYLPEKGFIDAMCTDGIRAEIMFPTCWNGELDSPNHMDHVAYPRDARNGECPDGYDQRLPALFFETIYNTLMFREYKGRFIFANGDPTGYGYHGDFVSAWEGTTLQDAIDNPACTNPMSGGEQSACPVLDIKPEVDYKSCTMETPEVLLHEKLDFVDALPGNVRLYEGPGWAAMPSHAPSSEPAVSEPQLPSTMTLPESAVDSTLYGTGTAIGSATRPSSDGIPEPSVVSSPSIGTAASTFSAAYTPSSPTMPLYSNTSAASPVPTSLVTTTSNLGAPINGTATVTRFSTDPAGVVVEWVVLQEIDIVTVYVDRDGRPIQPPGSTSTSALQPVKRHRHKHVRVHL